MISSQAQQPLTTEAADFTPDEQKIVQALSGEEYYWRSLNRISEATGLEREALDAAMTQLLRRDIVKPVFGKRSIIFGLRARVDKK